ncbi:hypothetical protein Brsp01_49140 [Brucella sp. NBRC 12950]|nr:hypothetical protein Brsp01_49140 [Brucella sp. NBRC 12950]
MFDLGFLMKALETYSHIPQGGGFSIVELNGSRKSKLDETFSVTDEEMQWNCGESS